MNLLRQLLRSPLFLLGFGTFLAALVVSVAYPLLSQTDPLLRGGLPFMPPSGEHWLGTNNQGQDLFAQVLYGLRGSLYVGVAAGLIATLLGTVLGLAGGTLGGRLDDFLTMTTNLFLVIPSLIVLILISHSLSQRSMALIALIIGATTWTWTARAVRAQAQSLKSRDHVHLARLNGDGPVSIMFLQIMPYMLSYIFMAFILQMATGILSESALSMIGLGPYDTITLGQILNSAQQNEALTNGNWWAFLPAALLVTLVTFSLYMANTAMEGVFNPRLRR